MRVFEGRMQFVNCSELDADKLTVLADVNGTPSADLDPAWVVQGETTAFPQGTVVTVGVVPEGWNELQPLKQFDRESGVVQYYLQQGDEDSIFARFDLGDIPESSWQNTRRGVVDSPCS